MSSRLRLVAATAVATGLLLLAPALPAGAAPLRDAGAPGASKGAGCVPGTAGAARVTRPADGPAYTDAQRRSIDRALRQVTLKQLGLQLANRPRVHIRLLSEIERQEEAPPLDCRQ